MPAGWALGLVLLLAALTHLPVLRNGFTNWDDPANVLLNPIVMSPSWSGLVDVWCRPINNMYAPLVFMSFIVDGLAGGGSPWPFHLTNLLLHLAATAAVFGILRLVVAAPRSVAAAAGALIFAVHPLQAEPVAWVTGRKDLLAGALGLLAIWLHLESSRNASRRRSRLLLAAGAAAFALSVLAKATVVALPFAVLVLQVLVGRKPWRKSALDLAPWFLAALVISLPALAAQPMPQWLKQAVPVSRRPLAAAYALAFYAGKVVCPIGLAPVYTVNATEAAQSHWSLLCLLAVLIAFSVAVWLRGRAAAALCLFFAPLLPVLGFVPFLYQQISITADRYVYLSMLGVATAGAWLVEWAWPLVVRRRLVVGGLASAIVVCCVLTNRQVRFWHDSKTLWRRGVEISAGVPEAHTNLAFALFHEGELPQAETQLELAVRADPDFDMAWSLLAQLRLQRSGPEAALPALRQTVRSLEKRGYRDRRLAEACSNLGYALTRKGDYAGAERELRRSIALMPLADAYENLAEALQGLGRTEEAKQALLEAAKRGPARSR